LKLRPAQELPAKVKCPRCATRFTVDPSGTTVLSPPRPAEDARTPFSGAEAATSPEPAPLSVPALLGVICVGVLFVGTGIGLAIYCFSVCDKELPGNEAAEPRDSGPEGARRNPRGPDRPPKEPPASPAQVSPPKAGPEVNPAPVPAPPPSPPPRAKANRVNQAIDRGVEYLQGCLTGTNRSPYRYATCGPTALAGLTLLSCGVPANDPAVVKAVERVRKDGPKLLQTYDMAVCIWLLDKLNDARDRELIQTLALRLIASQGVNGGWNYTCYLLTDQQQKTLLSLLQSRPLAGKLDGDGPKRTGPGKSKTFPPVRMMERRLPKELVEDVAELPVLQFRSGQSLELQLSRHEDNSLTQFVILALWAAQKHGVPAERSLALADARFRASQNADGSWAYLWVPAGKSDPRYFTLRNDSMTCAGLLGLAVGRGVHGASKLEGDGQGQGKKPPLPALVKDPAVIRAFEFLGKTIGKPVDAGKGRTGQVGSLIGARSWGDLYFLWSVERVAVVYDVKTIAGKDWYAWGSEVIVNAQQDDGSWREAFPGMVDTCFALLFLRRVNVVPDLTSKLQVLEGP
jgi:hypothetical protein